MNRILLLVVSVFAVPVLAQQSAQAGPAGVFADYNNDGYVSHADYSVLGDAFGTTTSLPNSPSPGVVGISAFAAYAANYNQHLYNFDSSPGPLPFNIGVVADGDNWRWTIKVAGLNGALAGHLNINVAGSTILSVTAGTGFRDKGSNPVGVPGVNAANALQQGISFSGSSAFVALGTTLTAPPLLNSNSTLEFVSLVTQGRGVTTVSYSGKHGYQGVDYSMTGSATSVPEPTTLLLLAMAALAVVGVRRR